MVSRCGTGIGAIQLFTALNRIRLSMLSGSCAVTMRVVCRFLTFAAMRLMAMFCSSANRLESPYSHISSTSACAWLISFIVWIDVIGWNE